MALKFFKKKVSDLEKDLTNTKIFLNMIIHEIRNPINNINFAIDSGLNSIKKASTLLIKYEQDLLNDSILYQ
jgi:signal transduction histidine kinase